jgi:hypothetical protein
MAPYHKQPERKAKVGIKRYHDKSKVSFAAGPRKYRRKPMPGGQIPWVHPKRYTKFYMNDGMSKSSISPSIAMAFIDSFDFLLHCMEDELPDLEGYLQKFHFNRDHKNSTPSERLRWKQELEREKMDLHRWTQSNLKAWHRKKQAEAHRHFYFLKGALADLQNLGSQWGLSPLDVKLAHQVIRCPSIAERYHDQPVEHQKQWLKDQLF